MQEYLQKLKNFLQFAQSYLARNNPIKNFTEIIMSQIRDFLTFDKKMKMAKYRVNYQKYKLDQMQKLIAQNNEHVFLKGRTLNETR
ncbi:MAG: hypothetical protein K6C94_07705 [Candidatus Gastranaerophilales bacterium]|nr:hypothetical protein [Candidatus Gastranaerophilales bacterium]